jgi:hypothetical protein
MPGPLREERQGKIVEFACRVAHRYTPLAMEGEHQSTVERSLREWEAMRDPFMREEVGVIVAT